MKLKLFFFLCSVLLVGQAQEILKLTGQEKELSVSGLSVVSDGALSYFRTKGEKRQIVRSGLYDYAWIPMPKEVADADKQFNSKNYEKAEDLYQKAYEKYKLLGWDLYCILNRAKAFAEMGKLKEAEAFLVHIKDYRTENPRLAGQLSEMLRLYADILIKNGKTEKAKTLLDTLQRSRNAETAAFAFLRKGDLTAAAGDSREAARVYVQAVFLFPDSSYHAEALFKTIRMLRKCGDDRSRKFEELLKKTHPDSPWLKQLSAETPAK